MVNESETLTSSPEDLGVDGHPQGEAGAEAAESGYGTAEIKSSPEIP